MEDDYPTIHTAYRVNTKSFNEEGVLQNKGKNVPHRNNING